MIIGFVYLVFSNPTITSVANILVFTTVFWLNLRSVKRTLLAVALVMVVSVAVELLGVFAFGVGDKPSTFAEAAEYRSVMAIMIVNLSQFIVATLINRFARNKRGIDIPNGYWGSILIIPIGTYYFIYIMLMEMEASGNEVVVVCTLVILMNLVVFTMFDAIRRFYKEKEEKESVHLLTIGSTRQLEVIEESTQNMHAVNHDLKRHLRMISGMIQDGKVDSATAYIDDIVSTELEDRSLCKTGNYIIDSIVNYELGRVDLDNINITSHIHTVPNDIQIKDYELTSILSNLLDNARSAIAKSGDENNIELTIEYKLGLLYIFVANTYDTKLVVENGKLQTTKADKSFHGFGLKNIERIVEKYDGEVTADYDDAMFSVEVVMYC